MATSVQDMGIDGTAVVVQQVLVKRIGWIGESGGKGRWKDSKER
jgi:hypothetical protein